MGRVSIPVQECRARVEPPVMFRSGIGWVALLAAAVIAAPAGAAPPAIGTPEFDQLVQVATGYWPAPPCGGAVEYAYADLPGTTVGYASWMQPAVAAPDPAAFSACRIDIERALDVESATLCTVIVHELGHLRGLVHATDPADVMYANLRSPLAECAAAFPPPAEVAQEVAVVLEPRAAAPRKQRWAKRGRAKALSAARAQRRAARRARAGAAG